MVRDNGKEFALHQEIASDFTIDFYFARPYHSNGLIIRRHIPKKANFDDYTDKEIQSIEQQINLRPRKRCNFVTPIEMFNPKVAFVA
jgi:IS30 family transposase